MAERLAGTARQKGPLVLFATHYFELTELATLLSRVKNFHAAVREWTYPDGIIHRIVDDGLTIWTQSIQLLQPPIT